MTSLPLRALRKRLGLDEEACPLEVLQAWRRLHRRLDLPVGVTPQQVRSKWRKLALELHSDKEPDPGKRAAAEERFRLAKEAAELLRDVDAHVGFAASQRPTFTEPAPDVPSSPGEDLEHLVDVELLHALRGGAWSVRVDLGLFGWRQIRCTLPAGTEPGLQIRVAGEGGPGSPPGALWLVVASLVHPTWRLEGLDVLAPLSVTAAAFYAGAHVVVDTPWQSVQVKLRACDPRRIRLNGHGVRRGQQRGDMVLTPDVVWPAPGDAGLMATLRRLQP